MPTFPNKARMGDVRKILNDTGLMAVNNDAGRAPTNSDDRTAGYEVGSRWFFADRVWTCTNSDEGAAIWEDANSLALSADAKATEAQAVATAAAGAAATADAKAVTADNKATAADAKATEAQAVQARRDFATFYLADYLHPDDLSMALQGQPASQDIDRVTAAVQAFHHDAIFAWASRTGPTPRVKLIYIYGSIRINDEMFSEATCDLLWDTGWERRYSKIEFDFQHLHVLAQFDNAVAVRNSGPYAEMGITYPVRRCVFRLMKKVISSVWLAEASGRIAVEMTGDPARDPDGFYICNVNGANFRAVSSVRNTCGTGYIIEAAFNSIFDTLNANAGWQPTEFGASAGLIPSAARFSNVGKVVTCTQPIFDAAHAGRFFALGKAGALNAGGGVRMTFWSQIASVDSPTQITLTDTPNINVTDARASFESIRGSTTAGSNVLTLSAAITGFDLTGHRVMVVGTKPNTEYRATHLFPATVLAHSGASLTLNLSAADSLTDAPVILNPAFHLGPTDLTTILGLSNNDMVSLPRLWTEDGGYRNKCAAQAVIMGVHLDIDTGAKIHGCPDSNGNNFGGNFTNFIVNYSSGFRYTGTSTHGHHSPRWGKHMFVGRQVDCRFVGESNSYPAGNRSAEIYLMPLGHSAAIDKDQDFRIFWGMDVNGFGGDGFAQQSFVRTNGQTTGRAVRTIGSAIASKQPGGSKLNTYVDDLVVDGLISGNAVQQSVTDSTSGRLPILGAFGILGATSTPEFTGDPATLDHTSVWRMTGSAHLPTTDVYMLLHFQRFPGQSLQIAYRIDPSPELFIRRTWSGGVSAWTPLQMATGGNTANRPTSPSLYRCVFDTTLGKPIWWNGTAWVDATGTTV